MNPIRPFLRLQRRLLATLVLMLAMAVLWTPVGHSGIELVDGETVPTEPSTDPTVDPAEPVSATIRAVQANVKSRMKKKKFKADIAAIYAQQPDFVTFNEVTYRPDSWLVPAGYAMWRTPGAYTGEAPVVWNTSRWTKVDQGTWQISDTMRKKKNTKKFQLGLRYANWVSLQSNVGQRISVVSTHFAPPVSYLKDITTPSFERLAQLVDKLKSHGPVLVGGDLNVNYRSAATYPRTLVSALGMTPVYDVTGVALPTGMYRNATIDYFLLGAASQFTVIGQTARAVHSDHRQLTVDLALTGSSASAFVPGTIFSDPATSPRAITKLMVKSLNLAPKGAVVHLLSSELAMKSVEKAIIRARKRHVKVQVLTASVRPTAVERRLAGLLGTKTKKKSWITHQPKWSNYGLPYASALVSASGGTRALRIDSSQPLVRGAHKVATRAVITADKTTYDQLFVQFFKAAGRKI